MLSPLNNLVKRLGVDGRLVPFYKCVCVYFLVSAASDENAPEPSAVTLAAKCAPVLSLVLVVLLYLPRLPPHRRGYARLVALGLALSALGDALLTWPARLVAGMAAFGAAHVAYAAAFGLRPRAWRLGGAAAAGAALAQVVLAPPRELRGAVLGYSALLGGMAWRGGARGGRAAQGAALFVLSDALLGCALFAAPLPHARLLVMSTYFLAQLAIALSALEP